MHLNVKIQHQRLRKMYFYWKSCRNFILLCITNTKSPILRTFQSGKSSIIANEIDISLWCINHYIYRDKLHKMVSNTCDIVLDSKLCVWQVKVSAWSVRSDLPLVWEGNYNMCTLIIEY